MGHPRIHPDGTTRPREHWIWATGLIFAACGITWLSTTQLSSAYRRDQILFVGDPKQVAPDARYYAPPITIRLQRPDTVQVVPAVPARQLRSSDGGTDYDEGPRTREMYRVMDAMLHSYIAPSDWSPVATLPSRLVEVESNTIVSSTACAEKFCRVELHTASGMSQNDWVETISASLEFESSALAFRYPRNRSDSVVVYIFRPALPLAMPVSTSDKSQ